MGAKTVVVFIDGFPFPWPASVWMAQFREDRYDGEENIYMPLLGTAKRRAEKFSPGHDLCADLCIPAYGPTELMGSPPRPLRTLDLDSLSFGPKQQSSSSHQLGLKPALDKMQVLQNSAFPRN